MTVTVPSSPDLDPDALWKVAERAARAINT